MEQSIPLYIVYALMYNYILCFQLLARLTAKPLPPRFFFCKTGSLR